EVRRRGEPAGVGAAERERPGAEAERRGGEAEVEEPADRAAGSVPELPHELPRERQAGGGADRAAEEDRLRPGERPERDLLRDDASRVRERCRDAEEDAERRAVVVRARDRDHDDACEGDGAADEERTREALVQEQPRED